VVLPTVRLAGLVAMATVLATVAGLTQHLRGPLAALDAMIVLAVAIDALAVRGRRIEAERSITPILSVGRNNLVTLTPALS